MMSPEFSRLVPVDRVPPEGSSEHIAATEEEREALARRFGLLAIKDISAHLQLEPWRRGGIKVSGRWDARVEQTCVVTLEPFEEVLREDVARYFAGQNAPGSSPRDTPCATSRSFRKATRYTRTTPQAR